MEAARICTGAMRQTNADKILTEVVWERIECRRKWYKLIICFNYKYSGPIVPRCRTSLFKNSFLPSTIRHRNGLDIDMRNSNSLNIFKNKLKLHYLFSLALNYVYTGYRKASIYHSRLRLGMSSLAAHPFPYGSSDSPYCSCGAICDLVAHTPQMTEPLVAIRDLVAHTPQRTEPLVAIRDLVTHTPQMTEPLVAIRDLVAHTPQRTEPLVAIRDLVTHTPQRTEPLVAIRDLVAHTPQRTEPLVAIRDLVAHTPQRTEPLVAIATWSHIHHK